MVIFMCWGGRSHTPKKPFQDMGKTFDRSIDYEVLDDSIEDEDPSKITGLEDGEGKRKYM